MYQYVCDIELAFNFTDNNAIQAANYCNYEGRTKTIDLIERDTGIKLISYRWHFHQNQGQIVVLSNDKLSKIELQQLNNWTRDEISDGIGEDFSAQSFADVRKNQSVNPSVDFSNQFGPYADYDMITLPDTKLRFILKEADSNAY